MSEEPQTTESTDVSDALRRLAEEHRAVRRLFEQAVDPELAREALQPAATQACAAWTRVARIEEELFYPRLTASGLAEEKLHEALIEHQLAAKLVKRLGETPPDEPAYRAALVVLGECVARHLEKEEQHLFPLASALDLRDIAERLRARQDHARAGSARREGRTADGRLDVGTAEDRNPPLP